MIGDLILDAYVQPEAVIDLTTDEDEPILPQIWLGEWVVLDEIFDANDLPERTSSLSSPRTRLQTCC